MSKKRRRKNIPAKFLLIKGPFSSIHCETEEEGLFLMHFKEEGDEEEGRGRKRRRRRKKIEPKKNGWRLK